MRLRRGNSLPGASSTITLWNPFVRARLHSAWSVVSEADCGRVRQAYTGMLYWSVTGQSDAGIPSSIATDAIAGAIIGVKAHRPSAVNIDQYWVLDCGMNSSDCFRCASGRRAMSRKAVTMGKYDAWPAASSRRVARFARSTRAGHWARFMKSVATKGAAMKTPAIVESLTALNPFPLLIRSETGLTQNGSRPMLKASA